MAARQFLLLAGDLLILCAALVAAIVLRQWGAVPPEFILQHVPAAGFLFAAWLGTFYAAGLYDAWRIRNFTLRINDFLLALAANVLVGMAFFYLFGSFFSVTPKTNLLLLALIGHAGAFGWRQLWLGMISLPALARRVAFLGKSSMIRDMERDLTDYPFLGYEVVSVPTAPAPAGAGASVHYRIPKPTQRSAYRAPFDILVVDTSLVEKSPETGSTLFSYATVQEIPIVSQLDFYEEIYKKIPVKLAARPTWLLDNVFPRAKNVYPLFKRFMDICGASLGLLIVPPLAAIILAVDRRNPFYGQKRFGYLGKRFIMWKFRTMVPGSDRDGYRWNSGAKDPRVTGLGRLLRRLRLDEIPQLWNVLRGEMSLVGPRPTWVQEKQALSMPEYHLRHLVKPGLTGWAQINSRSTSSEANTREKLRYDLYYVKNCSLALDIAIILKTIRRILHGEEFFEKQWPFIRG